MADDAPFQQPPPPESERTVIRPCPGARGAPRTPAPVPEQGAPVELPEAVAASPLLACAHPLLALVPQLRATTSYPDPAALRESLSNGVRAFEQAAQRAGIAHETIVAARYVLCTFLDETAAGTPWGSGGVWASDTLLVRFHNETWGGEKVFALLSRLAEDPARHRDLLELVYDCLALGFQGRYGAIDNGRAQLDQIRERLYQMLRGVRGEPEHALSPEWAPAQVVKRRWIGAAPFWAFGAVIAAVALGAWFVYSALLANRSDPVFAGIQSIRLPSVAPLPPPQPAPPAAQARLARFLEAEIREGLVAVRDEANKSVVTIRGDGFFEPGSAVVSQRVLPVLARIGRALADNPGSVLIAGHTDSQPIRSARFPSNWHLSQERALAVLQVLAAQVPPARMKAEGRADSEPLAPNDTPAGRARNRRVDVTLFVTNG